MSNLESLLQPKSIAVIGASRDKGKLGRLVLDNIINHGFKGKVYPVNPKSARIGKLKCYKSVRDIPGRLDLALIAIPSKFVYSVVKECCDKKVGSIAVISSGFSEIGQEGLKEELKIKGLAGSCGINFLGPNCLGIISTNVKLNATFAKNKVSKGNIAFLSQSGALGTAALDWAEESGVGFSHFISLGNKASLSENAFLKYLSEDREIDAIVLYLEDFSDGKNFIKIASKIKKPIIVLKPGKSEAAQIALGSHTGSLAQDDLIVSKALKQAQVLRVETIEELFNVMKLFSYKKKLEGNKIAIVTNAGGPGVITTDAVELTGLKLAQLANKSQQYLALKLPGAANFRNPIDVLGDALADRYEVALKTAISDRGVDGVIVILTPQVMTEIEKTAEVIYKASRRTDKFIVSVFIGGKEVKKGAEILARRNMPFVSYPDDAVKALAYIVKSKTPKKEGKTIQSIGSKQKKNVLKVSKLIQNKHGALDTQVSEKIIKIYKIPVLESYFPQDIAAARKFVKKLKFPVVMKLIHPDLLHKTDLNAVKLNITGDNELRIAFGDLVKQAGKLRLEGYKVQMQHFVKGALELIIGVKCDQDQYVDIGGRKVVRKRGFGHSIMFGMGGIYTEIYKDVSLRIAPLTMRDINELINETKVSRILKGARGIKYNMKKVREILAKLSQLVVDFPQIAELDINPLFAKGDDVWVVDVKMILE